MCWCWQSSLMGYSVSLFLSVCCFPFSTNLVQCLICSLSSRLGFTVRRSLVHIVPLVWLLSQRWVAPFISSPLWQYKDHIPCGAIYLCITFILLLLLFFLFKGTLCSSCTFSVSYKNALWVSWRPNTFVECISFLTKDLQHQITEYFWTCIIYTLVC